MVNRSLRRHSTSTFDKFLLMALGALLPLQDHIPGIAGFSIMFIFFAIIAGHVFLHRQSALSRIWLHPVFVAGYTLVIVGSLMELGQPHWNFTRILHIGEMIAGATLVASLSRDRGALRSGIYGYLIAGLWMSGILFLTSYGALHGASASNFLEASQVRAQVTSGNTLKADLNAMSVTCAIAALVALALALAESSPFRRNIFFAMGLFCFVATFLPMSRTGVVSLIVFSAIIMWEYKVRMKTIITAVILGGSILILVPDVVVSRLTLSSETRGGGKSRDARVHFYKVAYEHLPQYILTGVGVGNFWGPWGEGSGYYKVTYRVVYGPHNMYIMVALYWGLAGLLLFFNLIYQAYRWLPSKEHRLDPLALCVLVIAVSLFLMTFYSHGLASKQFSLGLGLLVGTRVWIWTGSNRVVAKRKLVDGTIGAQRGGA